MNKPLCERHWEELCSEADEPGDDAANGRPVRERGGEGEGAGRDVAHAAQVAETAAKAADSGGNSKDLGDGAIVTGPDDATTATDDSSGAPDYVVSTTGNVVKTGTDMADPGTSVVNTGTEMADVGDGVTGTTDDMSDTTNAVTDAADDVLNIATADGVMMTGKPDGEAGPVDAVATAVNPRDDNTIAGDETGSTDDAGTTASDGAKVAADVERLKKLADDFDLAHRAWIGDLPPTTIDLARKGWDLGRALQAALADGSISQETLAKKIRRSPSWVSRLKKATEEAPKSGPRNQADAISFLASFHGNRRSAAAHAGDRGTTTEASVDCSKLSHRIETAIRRAIKVGNMSPDEVRGIVEEALSRFVNEIDERVAPTGAADSESAAAA